MSEAKVLLEVWGRSYRDLGKAFDGVSDESVHRRPGPGAMAISEIAAHVARTEGLLVLGENSGQLGRV
ncbi:MAG: hypothetical protein IH851_10765 [Armatimonadetes bacterium]|nr:hypothetical protein [Armatimonadota bacterium]